MISIVKKITLTKIINIIILFYILSIYIFTFKENLNLISNILALFLIFLIWINLLITKRKIIFNKFLLIYLIFILICFFSIIYALDPIIAYTKVKTLVLIYILVFSITNYVDTFKKIQWIISSFVISGFFASIYILIVS